MPRLANATSMNRVMKAAGFQEEDEDGARWVRYEDDGRVTRIHITLDTVGRVHAWSRWTCERADGPHHQPGARSRLDAWLEGEAEARGAGQ